MENLNFRGVGSERLSKTPVCLSLGGQLPVLIVFAFGFVTFIKQASFNLHTGVRFGLQCVQLLKGAYGYREVL